MRILMLTPALPHAGATNAGALVMYEQLRRVARRHTVTLATFAGPEESDRGGIDSLRELGIEVHPVWRPHYAGFSLWRRRFEVFGFATRSWYGWLRRRYPRLVVHAREPEMKSLIGRLLSSARFDIVQVEDSVMASYDLPTTAPKLLTEHEVRLGDEDVDADAEPQRWRHYLLGITRRFHLLQVFTPRDAAALLRLDPTLAPRVRVNPFGVTLPEKPVGAAGSGLVFVGGFNHPPNVDAACWLVNEVMPLIWERLPAVRLTIVGKDPPPSVQALASPWVEVTGRVPAVEPYVDRAAVVLAPLRRGGGMRLKVLQAMAAGKPVVTTSLGAEGLLGGREELPLAIADDAQALAAQTVRLLADPAERDRLGRRAHQFVAERHRWESYIQRLEATYDELLAAR